MVNKMELVDRVKLIAQYSANPEIKGFIELIQDDYVVEALKKAEVVDAAPVVHAKWKLDRYATEWTCSNCEGEMLYQITTYGGGQYHDIDNIFPPYCPHCGAKMDLE